MDAGRAIMKGKVDNTGGCRDRDCVGVVGWNSFLVLRGGLAGHCKG